ncbi:MAG: hypothetical protein AABY14_03545 [Nanoarchaeota archaeon]
MQVEILVELKIPDTTAITTFQILKRIGYNRLTKVRRMEYYKFSINGSLETFTKEIIKADPIINVNKHRYYIQKKFSWNFFFQGDKELVVSILVKNIKKEIRLLGILKNRLGLNQIKDMESGILWGLYFENTNKIVARKLSIEIAKKLLVNENYQRFEILC